MILSYIISQITSRFLSSKRSESINSFYSTLGREAVLGRKAYYDRTALNDRETFDDRETFEDRETFDDLISFVRSLFGF